MALLGSHRGMQRLYLFAKFGLAGVCIWRPGASQIMSQKVPSLADDNISVNACASAVEERKEKSPLSGLHGSFIPRSSPGMQLT